ncbi:DUF502 domain-containing protein [Dongia deserti]|uniref:DUF502 domain-containing protein n=1 Tax=Dongia deserti TaxID=2268030 RepID=UPI000E65E02C|nr:DUF502 domain-containing protein [Dongia deserti]
MTEKKPRAFQMSLGARLRAYFFAGVLITAPVSLTIYLAWLFITFVDERVFSLLPPQYHPETYLRFSIPGIGLLLAIIGLTLIGALTAGILGRAVNLLLEGILNRLPVIRSLYGAIKQIMETVLANKSAAFRECVLIEYPRRGIWTLGFITGRTKGEVQERTAEETINVFVPTTPNPTSGFLLFVPEKDIIRLQMPIEDGLKLVVSGGIVTPPTSAPALPPKEPVSQTSRS